MAGSSPQEVLTRYTQFVRLPTAEFLFVRTRINPFTIARLVQGLLEEERDDRAVARDLLTGVYERARAHTPRETERQREREKAPNTNLLAHSLSGLPGGSRRDSAPVDNRLHT